MKKNDEIALTKEQKRVAVEKIQAFMLDQFELETGNLRAGFLLDFMSKELGAFYYNQGIADAMSFMTEKAEDLYLLMKEEER